MILHTWDHLELGVLDLRTGSTTLTVQALSMPGDKVMQLNAVTLTRLDDED